MRGSSTLCIVDDPGQFVKNARFGAAGFCCLVLLPTGGVVSHNECQSIAAIVGSYVDERMKLQSRKPVSSGASRPSKIDVIRLYRRSALQLGHSQPDQRFHLELLRLSKASDYDEDGPVMLAHSNRFLEERCGMSRTALGRQLRRHDGTTLRRSLSGNGHRFVARKRNGTGDGSFIEGCGISLEPLISLMMSMRATIAAQDELDLALAVEKARIGRDRRRQRAALELLDERHRGSALAHIAESKLLIPAIRSAIAGGRLGELERLSRRVTEIADRIEGLAEHDQASDCQVRTPEGCETGHQLPLQGPDLSGPVVAGGDASRETQDRDFSQLPRWTPRTIVACFPSLAMYVGVTSAGDVPSWRTIDGAASRLARDLGINVTCWQRALFDMGPEQRCVAIGLVAELFAAGRISGTAGQYFGGMLKRARCGELHLDRSVWGFRRKCQAG